jgi:serine/threonine-protein kinase
VAEAPLEPPPAPRPSVAPEPPSVKFRILSDPLGARVSIAKKVLGVTPLDFIAPADDDGTATVELSFVLKGYHPMTVITGGSGTVVLKQRLQSRLQPKPKDVIDARAKPGGSQAESGTVVTQSPNDNRPSPEEPVKAVAVAVQPSPPPPETKPAVTAPADSTPKPRLLPTFVANLQRISTPAPHLPVDFTQQHAHGTYEGKYRICIGTDGHVTWVAAISGLPGADPAIISHLKETWLYRPQAVPFCTEHRFIFKLDSDFARAEAQ